MEVGESAKELGPSFRWRMTAETEVAVPRGSTEGVLAEAHPKCASYRAPFPIPFLPTLMSFALLALYILNIKRIPPRGQESGPQTTGNAQGLYALRKGKAYNQGARGQGFRA